MRIAPLTVAAALALAALAGCGSNDNSETPRPRDDAGGSERAARPSGAGGSAPAGATAHECGAVPMFDADGVRASGISCGRARLLVVAWSEATGCGREASRSACSVRGFRCRSVSADRGRSVSCARRGRSVAFLVNRG